MLTLYRIYIFCFQMCNHSRELMKNGDLGISPVYYSLKYAPLTLGLDSSSCESDEYTDFDVFRTPPNDARGIMHCTSCWAFIYHLRSL